MNAENIKSKKYQMYDWLASHHGDTQLYHHYQLLS